MKINVKLLRRIKAHILEEPRRLRMSTWGRRTQKGEYGRATPPCGTAACLAGWTILLGDRKFKPRKTPGLIFDNFHGIRNRAEKLLGIPENTGPFEQTEWGKAKVLRWIDSKLAEARKG